jgi:hypothetical protein
MHRLSHWNPIRICAAAALCCVVVLIAQENPDLGFKDTPMLPGQPWHVHDSSRPHPRTVTPGATPGAPPSDAIVLFDGKDLSRWAQDGRGRDRGKIVDAKWKVANGYFEIAPGTGDMFTREKFGDCQLHLEWAAPPVVRSTSQDRGNSGVYFMRRYEIQVLDAWDNPTYPDGRAGAIYGQWPPLVSPARRPGEWNIYDIAFEAPRFENGKMVRPPYQTVFYNGVLVHNHKEVLGPSTYRALPRVAAHGEDSLDLQDHGHLVRFRNIWIRRIGQYDKP